jgi:hypothetical protein
MQRTLVLFIKFYPTLRSNDQFRTFYNFLFNLAQRAMWDPVITLHRPSSPSISFFIFQTPPPEKSKGPYNKLCAAVIAIFDFLSTKKNPQTFYRVDQIAYWSCQQRYTNSIEFLVEVPYGTLTTLWYYWYSVFIGSCYLIYDLLSLRQSVLPCL